MADPVAAPSGRRPGRAAVLTIRPVRRLWLVLGLSAFGDWLGLLATAAFATEQVTGPVAQGLAFGSVIVVQLLPALIFGPFAGVLADRFDRRIAMVVSDLVRFVAFASIPTVGLLVDRPDVVVAWAASAMFVVQTAALVWTPAKEAALPNLLPKDQLEAANQLTLATTYGVTPVLAALALAALTRLPTPRGVDPLDVALYLNALTFLAAAWVVYAGIREISGRSTDGRTMRRGAMRAFVEGWWFVITTPLIRGLVLGVLGAFAAAGAVIGVARFYARSLGGGDATFAILFALVFVGLGCGIVGGPRLVGSLSRRRWFASSIMLAAVGVVELAIAPRLEIAVIGTLLTGAGAGMAFLSGVTLLGGEIDDDVRGRVFAFVQTTVRVTLMATIALAGFAVGVGSSRRLDLFGLATVDIAATRVLLLITGVAALAVGLASLRQIDDVGELPLGVDLWQAIARRRPDPATATTRRHPPAGDDEPRSRG